MQSRMFCFTRYWCVSGLYAKAMNTFTAARTILWSIVSDTTKLDIALVTCAIRTSLRAISSRQRETPSIRLQKVKNTYK